MPRHDRAHERRVDDKRHEVAHVDEVVALPAEQQVVEEAERESRRDAGDHEQRRDSQRPHELVRRVDDDREQRGEDEPNDDARRSDCGVDDQPDGREGVEILVALAPARVRSEAHHRRADAEVEQAHEHRHRPDQRPQPVRLLAEVVDDHRRQDER